MKPGIQSTEFWKGIVPIIAIVILLVAKTITIEQVPLLWPLFVPIAGYQISRGISKMNGNGKAE